MKPKPDHLGQEYLPYDLVEELEQHHFFQQSGFLITYPIPFKQSGEDYLQLIHSRNDFSREHMGKEAALAFDEEVRSTISPFLQGGQLLLFTVNTVVWRKTSKTQLVITSDATIIVTRH